MKAKLEFDLERPGDVESFNRCGKAADMANVLFQFSYNVKKSVENSIEDKLLTPYEAVDLVYEKFNNLMQESNINLDELIT